MQLEEGGGGRAGGGGRRGCVAYVKQEREEEVEGWRMGESCNGWFQQERRRTFRRQAEFMQRKMAKLRILEANAICTV